MLLRVRAGWDVTWCLLSYCRIGGDVSVNRCASNSSSPKRKSRPSTWRLYVVSQRQWQFGSPHGKSSRQTRISAADSRATHSSPTHSSPTHSSPTHNSPTHSSPTHANNCCAALSVDCPSNVWAAESLRYNFWVSDLTTLSIGNVM